MAFLEGEIVIVNQNVAKGLPSRVGESAMIIENLIDSPNYNYRIEFLDGETAKVKESEINKLTEIDKYYMNFVYAGNKAIYAPMNEEVQIVTTDYLHCKAEVEFVSGGVTVVDFDRLTEIEGEKVEEVKVESTILDKFINVFLKHYENEDGTYTVPKQLLINLLDNIFEGVE